MRDGLRASSTLATLKQTISMTDTAARISRRRAGTNGPATCSCSGITRSGPRPHRRGSSACNVPTRAASSRSAAATDTPSLRRPMKNMEFPCQPVRPLTGIAKGSRTSTRLPGANSDAKSKLGGSTPTTVRDSPFNLMREPTMSRSPPNRRCHNPCERSTAGGAPLHAPSSTVKFRPSWGRTPSTSSRSCVTLTPDSRSGAGSPSSV
jgi:hypothetical protein